MSKPYVTLLGKAVRYITRLRGGGSALPGLFVEKIDPDFIKRTLSTLPQGVVVISGTNGKTTTTKMVVELLESQGLKVFTNRTGSNFTRGVAAALLGEVDNKGVIDADIAILELDEAHAVSFVKNVPPRYSLLLNVMRDQLDRFGEIDATAKMLAIIAKSTTETVVLNREDPRVAAIAGVLTYQKINYFGLSPKLAHLFPNDDEMRGKSAQTGKRQTLQAGVVLESLKEGVASFTMDGHSVSTALKLQGIYNVYNAAAALALAGVIVGETMDKEKLVAALAEITPAFGRGETVVIGGQPLELVLVKNPSGFRLSLSSFKPEGYATMIAINDNYADGRDMSWLWDVEFDSLKEAGVAEVTGMRAYDMALRLQYDEVLISHVEPDLTEALRHFITSNADSPKRIFCTYTSMLALRRELSKMTEVEVIS
ncbi:MAG TPA: MurT ligase domain-containing protein [Candidatus Saccharimonadales bacterium]|nr:MurT ligase domain-containing protein [Candidatus Saccharimonadales bacterium]